MTRYRTGDESNLIRIIASMDRRLKNLESGNRIGFTSIDSGHLVDNTGITASLIGGSGSSAGTAANTINTGETYNSATYGDLATIGPSFSVQIGQPARALVIISANIHMVVAGSGDTNFAFMSFVMDNGTTVLGPTETLAAGIRIVNANASAITLDLAVSKVIPYTAFTPGTYSVTAKYAGGTGTGGAVTFANRSLAVLPY